MSEIKVIEPHNTTPPDAIKKIGEFESMLKKWGVKARWSGSDAKLKGTGVSGHIKVDKAQVEVLVKLGMLAKAAGVDAGRLENSIRKRLKAAFGNE